MLHTVRHSFLFASCVATLAALSPAAALAQPAPAPQAAPVPVDEARQHFELGVAAMQAQRWPEAFAEFEASGRIRRSASVALNLGVVLREMRRFVEARVRLQEFNELATPAQHQQHDAQVQQMLTEISRRLGRVRVTEIAPPTATITVDGRRAQLNDANETVIDPGTHALRAEAAGFLPYEETLEIAESATRDVAVHLAPQPVETPPGAVVAPAAAAGTAQYDNHPPPPSLPGTAACDPPATPTPVQPAPIETTVEAAHAIEAPASRRGRRARPHARPAAGQTAPHAGSAHTNAPGGGTTEYDGN